MNAREARSLLAGAMPAEPGTDWADFGAGEGTFTRALVDLLGPDSRVYAVDRESASLASIEAWPTDFRRHVIPVTADLAGPFELPGRGSALLDGAVIANSLHYFRDPSAVLAGLVARVKAGGRVVIIEYDRRARNPWVPFPIPLRELPTLVSAARLSSPVITATRPSRFGGDLYVAAADRIAPES